MSTNPPTRSYYPALDGLRGVAILLVLFFHNFLFTRFFFFGWLGVDLFFVLSGFLITDILLRTNDSPYYLRNFFVKRILRIFPLYYLTLVIFLILFPAFHIKLLILDYYIKNQVWLWTYLQNWLLIFHPSNNTSALNHFWSLAVEEQFYLIWPFVILLFKKPKRILYLLWLLLLSIILFRFVLWRYHIENLSYFNLYTFSRIDGICIGSMLAVFRIMKSKAINRYFTFIILALAVLNFVFYFFNKKYEFSYPYLAIAGYTTFAVIFGLLVNEAVTQENNFIRKVLSLSVLKFFGRISYSLYIFHWPLYIMFSPLLQNWFGKNISFIDKSVAASVIATILAISLAFISFHFFEKKFLSLKKKFEYAKTS